MERKKEKEKNEDQEKNKRKERRIPDQRSKRSEKDDIMRKKSWNKIKQQEKGRYNNVQILSTTMELTDEMNDETTSKKWRSRRRRMW